MKGTVSGTFARLGRRSVTHGLAGVSHTAVIPRGSGGPHQDTARPERRTRPPHHEALRPGARQETLREANLMLITEEVFASGEPLSRADLSIRTGMTRSTVSRLVDDLLAAGIVREGSPVVGGSRGRPAVPLTPARQTLSGLGVEVNVDFMAARVMDLTGSVLAEEMVEEDFRDSDPHAALARAGEMAHRVAAQAGETGARVIGTVLAVPGLVKSDERTLLFAPNLGWKNVDVVSAFCQGAEDAAPGSSSANGTGQPEIFGEFVVAANEAKLAALAVAQELTEAEGKEQTFLYVSAQMGIGSAVVIDGVVEAGPHGWGGELGHISVEPSGPTCSCGSTGCLEVYAGKRAVLEAAGLTGASNALELVSLTEWEDDPGERATAAIERAGWALGVALSAAMNVLDVHDVVLGGEFGPITDLLRPRIEEQLQQRVLASAWTEFRVRESACRTAPAASGAAVRALRAVIDAPQYWAPSAAAPAS